MPDRIGKYEIRGEIGKGGFGKVYCGFDPTVGRLVAIKVLSSGGDPSILARFRTEATAAGNLNHKNIVTVFEFGEDQGTFFLVMEYLEGRDLQHVMPDAASLKLVDKMNIMKQVAEGLQCAHQHGIVHRDVKPANIMLLADGTVKIMDFGIARLTHADSARLTQSGFLIGTLSYMAPELLRGGEADALCDIWAFGTIYYELLGGQHPFEANDAAAAMYRIMSWDPPRMREIFSECPEALDNVIFRLLSKDRESRYQNLEDVLFDTAPILLELESQQAGRLVSQAQDLIVQGRLEEAEPLIRRILALDPLHQEGRALRKELQLALKRRSVQTRVQSLSEQSDQFAAAQNYADALHTLQTAAAIDPGDLTLSTRVKEMQAAKERYDLAQQFLTRARSDFEQSNLTAAFQAATEALQAEPGNSEARTLLGELRQKMTERDAERRLREGLSKVKGLIALQSFDEAIETLEILMRDGFDTAELRELLQRTRQQSGDHRRERQIRSEIEAAKGAIKDRRFDEAVSKLEPLANETSCKGEVAGLLAYAREELALAERAARIKSLGKEAWALLKAKDYDAALARVEGGLKTFPDEGMLLKLRQAVLAERAQEHQRSVIRQALEESAALERAGHWEQAPAPIEKALWQYPEEATLRVAFDQAKQKQEERKKAARLAALENDLKQAHRMLEEGQSGSATQLLQHLTVAYPGESAVVNLLDRARAEDQRRVGLETAYAEIRRSLQAGRPEEALETIARGRNQFGADPQLIALEAEAARGRTRNEAFEQAQRALRAQNWTLAESTLEAMLAQDGTDAEARRLLEDIRKERLGQQQAQQQAQQRALQEAQQREQLRANGRKEAARLLQNNQFDEAVRGLRVLCDQFPEDGGLRDELRGALDAQERQARREAYTQGRKQADALLLAGKFDEAIAAIERLLSQFPQDAALREDLKAAGEAKIQQERRARYNRERQRAAEMVRNRQFDEAIQVLEAMRQQTPGDAGVEEDLRSAQAAKGLQTERFQVNERVAKLEQFYRQGKPKMVKELATQLLAEIEEPRARELLDWAEEVLARPPSGIQTGLLPVPAAKNQFLLWGGLIVIVLASIVIVLKFAGRPAGNSDHGQKVEDSKPVIAQLTLSPDQLSFAWQTGDARPQPKTVGVSTSGNVEKWEATPTNAEWISITPAKTSFTVGVDPGKLGQGSYSGIVTVRAGQVQSLLIVKLDVKTTSPRPQDTPKPSLSLEPDQLSFEWQVGSPAPGPKTIAVHASGNAPKWKAVANQVDNWISVTPGDASLAVSVDPTKLARRDGNYTSFVTVTLDTVQANAIVKLTVTLPPEKQSKPLPPPPPPVRTPPIPPSRECGGGYTGRGTGTLTWTGSLKPDGILWLTRENTPFEGGGAIKEAQGLPGCEVTVELTPGPPAIKVEEGPSQQNHFGWIRLKNTSGMTLDSVTLKWTKTQ